MNMPQNRERVVFWMTAARGAAVMARCMNSLGTPQNRLRQARWKMYPCTADKNAENKTVALWNGSLSLANQRFLHDKKDLLKTSIRNPSRKKVCKGR
jgi:hypothetical protein